MRLVNLENENRKFIKTVDNFHVLEYVQDASVSPMNAIDEYYMSTIVAATTFSVEAKRHL